jgi:hypothetical protein
MRKLVFGIIAVLCVQFAFVNYMELQSPLDLAVAPVYTGPPAVSSDLNWIEELDRFAVLPPERETKVPAKVFERNFIARNEQDETVARPARFRSTEPGPMAPAKRPAIYFPATAEDRGADGFETVVISYNRASELSNCDKQEAPKAKRRSLLAKAIPAAKKPWEWMKTAGSKLY